jgi:hypothetical protein
VSYFNDIGLVRHCAAIGLSGLKPKRKSAESTPGQLPINLIDRESDLHPPVEQLLSDNMFRVQTTVDSARTGISRGRIVLQQMEAFGRRPDLESGLTKYDIIGDIHGCATELSTLLVQLGYRRDDAGVHRHPERTAVFVGDLVDRGPGQLEVLQTVKAMVDHGAAHIVMGNHEFNAICYATPHPLKPGDFLRTHEDPKNEEGHIAFLQQLTDEQRQYYLEWWVSPRKPLRPLDRTASDAASPRRDQLPGRVLTLPGQSGAPRPHVSRVA